MVEVAVEQARAAGCEWLHWDAGLAAFYVDACGFQPAEAGLIALWRRCVHELHGMPEPRPGRRTGSPASRWTESDVLACRARDSG